jgi:hypothetical protein
VTTRLHRGGLTATAVACLVALTVAACGSSTATKKEVIARGNAICASTLRAVRATVPPSGGSNTGTALNGYLQRVLPIVQKEVSQLQKLPRPDADKAVLNHYISEVAQAGDTYKTLAQAARRNDLSALAKALGTLRANPAGSLAKQYGMNQCATAAGTNSP